MRKELICRFEEMWVRGAPDAPRTPEGCLDAVRQGFGLEKVPADLRTFAVALRQ
ncbi:MAG: hypothetical protein J5838_01555 [Desulfovibrio sp.]|nr:hypothetical protein [Desulfovibrio sp.]